MKRPDDDITLRYLCGHASAEESAQVKNWLGRSDENVRTFEQLYFTLQLTDRLRVMNAADPDRALQAFRQRLRRKNESSRRKNWLLRIQRIAAVLFIPLAALLVCLLIPEWPEAPQYTEVRTNPGLVTSFSLPDGSKVWVDAGSYLKFPTRFTGNTREVELQGQGYFEVTKQPGKPFIVKVNPHYSVEVLGTRFNVTAYNDDNSIETTLVSGSVRLCIGLPNGKNIRQVLKPNEKAVYLKDRKALQLRHVNPEYDIVWKEGKIVFRNHPMEQVLRTLSRHYNVRFDVTDPQVLEPVITATFTDEQLPQVLEYLKLASGIRYKLKPDVIDNDRLKINHVELSK